MSNNLTLLPRVTIHPNHICFYKEVKWESPHTSAKFKTANDQELAEANVSFQKSSRKNNGYLSQIAKKKLNTAIDYLLITSDKKKVYSKLQRKYITFKIVFITLTLPSKQIHTDKEITNQCLNQFFIELSKYHNVRKFVWRAEKQENGNIHYHILINEFIEYQLLRKRWNRICNKLGYVDIYQRNMKEFYKSGFRPSNNPNDHRTVDQQRKAFIIGQRSDWTSPNSTDIHDVRKIHNIRRYVSKYMAKQPQINIETDILDNNNQIVNGRLWSCSQNLSNITGCQLVEDWEISDELEKVFENSKCYQYHSPYFHIMYLNSEDLIKFGSEKLFLYFARYLLDAFNYNLQLKIA